MKSEYKLKLTRIKPGYYSALNGEYILYRAANNLWEVRKNSSHMVLLQAWTLEALKLYYEQHGSFY